LTKAHSGWNFKNLRRQAKFGADKQCRGDRGARR